MPLYLTRFNYSSQAWAALIENPEDRRGPVGANMEAVGGKLHDLWYAFGDQDGYVLFEAPDNVSIAALLASVAATGQIKLSTTVLLSVEEMLEALGKSKSVAYRPPGGGA